MLVIDLTLCSKLQQLRVLSRTKKLFIILLSMKSYQSISDCVNFSILTVYDSKGLVMSTNSNTFYCTEQDSAIDATADSEDMSTTYNSIKVVDISSSIGLLDVLYS
jgi:hypothetical protein